MKIAIRVDSSTRIGSGHLMRCLTLAGRRQREDGAEVHFICRDLPGNLSLLVSEGGYRLHLLPRHDKVTGLSGYAVWLTVPQEVDAEETEAVLESLGQVDCLVVDSYALDASWESRMRHFAKEIFVIDDLANRKHDCDVLLDQNFYLDKEKRYIGLIPEHCRMLLGPAHALLREEFYEVKQHGRKRTGEIKNILIFYGGSDLTGETSKAIRAVLQLDLSKIQLHVVVGRSNPHKKSVEELCRQHEALHYHEQVSNIAGFMNEADLMLGAGGTTTCERCFLGLPSIVTAVAENQVQICRDCHVAGLIEYLGFYNAVRVQDIVRCIRDMTSTQRQLMSARCLQIFACEILQMEDLNFRLATWEDKDLLYEWRNDTAVRSASFSSQAVSMVEHKAWFRKKLADDACSIYVLEQESKPVGQVRLDRIDGDAYVSYSIASRFRGRGYGKLLLELAEQKAAKESLVLIGQVKKDNIASQVIFQSLGYEEKEQENFFEYRKKARNTGNRTRE